MIRFLTFVIFMCASIVPVFAADQSAATPQGMSYPQNLSQVRMDYHRGAKSLDLTFIDGGVLTGCGRLTDIPTKITYDFEAVDITIGDYAFIRPLGTGPHDCGATAKAAAGRAHLMNSDLIAHDVKRIRVWYKTDVDNFLVFGTGADTSLSAPYASRMIHLGRDLDHVSN